MCPLVSNVAKKVSLAVLSQLITFTLLLLLYPIRVQRLSRKRTSFAALWTANCLRIPSSFDPASLLYPIFLPVYVALSLPSANDTAVFSNIVLSLSSIPYQLIPRSSSQKRCHVVHWCIASVPLFVSTAVSHRSSPIYTPDHASTATTGEFSPEFLLYLYPLHQAIVPVLRDLTSTSLLSAERQLLSIGLINLLIHSASPQTVILKALLWGGGIAVLVFCEPVLRWGVMLARIPRWRFRRSGQVVRARNIFLEVFNRPVDSRRRGGSDADEDGAPGFDLKAGTQSKRSGPDHFSWNSTRPPVALQQKPGSEGNLGLNGVRSSGGMESHLDLSKAHLQRHTILDADNSPLQGQTLSEQLSSCRPMETLPFYVRSYLSLSPSQASLRKWLYAAYVYASILSIVVLGIRPYVEHHALDGQEPFGWALGYLFGNIRWFRFQVVTRNLESWICLPPSVEKHVSPSDDRSSVEHIRSDILGAANTRLMLMGYFLLILAMGIGTVIRLSNRVEVDTRRKVFHGMMVVMFLPATFIDPTFAAFSMALVLAVFLLLDVFRASQLPPVSKPLASFLSPYIDGRDLRGPVVVSHIFLLIGCAVPLWLSLAGIDRTGQGCWAGWDVLPRDVGMVGGVICVGMGDAAASLVGRRFGRRKWPWSGGKSLEGSIAFTVAVMSGLGIARTWLWVGGWPGYHDGSWSQMTVKCAIAATGASLTEAVLTGGNDNVMVPVVLWLFITGLGI